MQKNSTFNFRVGERTRELLEDFEVVATMQYMALIPKHSVCGNFKSNIRAAVVASTLRLSSIDYARRRYVSQQEGDGDEKSVPDAYSDAYAAAKEYMTRLMAKLTTSNKPDPTVGVFGASVVLERLEPSFFCAHFLYRMGHKYEGHAVARLILEQIAWAYSAHQSDDMAFIETIETTRSITALKRFAPEAGRLYGFLSAKTHIDYSSHMEFLRVEDGRNVVLHAQPDFDEYAKVILRLADLFGLVWEVTQATYLVEVETIVEHPNGDTYLPKPDRPFLAEMKVLLEQLTEIQNQNKQTA